MKCGAVEVPSFSECGFWYICITPKRFTKLKFGKCAAKSKTKDSAHYNVKKSSDASQKVIWVLASKGL